MSFPKLTFPLTVDFSESSYWIGSRAFPIGAAAAALLSGEDIGQSPDEAPVLVEALKALLAVFGNQLQPFAEERVLRDTDFDCLEKISGECTRSFSFHGTGERAVLVERCVFPTLRDFVWVELGQAILKGNAPRQCRLCGNWFLHVQGEKSIYCGRVAPGETGKTCREVGARAVFEKKVQDDGVWKTYKRAYKKYYARMMKGAMSREEFDVWAEEAVKQRDEAIRQMRMSTIQKMQQEQLAEKLREALNRQ